jgi:hypothetical protein
VKDIYPYKKIISIFVFGSFLQQKAVITMNVEASPPNDNGLSSSRDFEGSLSAYNAGVIRSAERLEDANVEVQAQLFLDRALGHLRKAKPMDRLVFAAEDCRTAIELLRGSENVKLTTKAYLHSAKAKFWYQGYKGRKYWETGEEDGKPMKKTRKRMHASASLINMANDPELGLVSALHDLYQAQIYDPGNQSVIKTLNMVKACLRSLIEDGVITAVRPCEIIINLPLNMKNYDPKIGSFGVNVSFQKGHRWIENKVSLELPLVSPSGTMILVPVFLSKSLHSFGLRIDMVYSHHLGSDVLRDCLESLGLENIEVAMDGNYRPFNVLTFSGLPSEQSRPNAFKPSYYFGTRPSRERQVLWQALMDSKVIRPRNLSNELDFGILSELDRISVLNSLWYCQF